MCDVDFKIVRIRLFLCKFVYYLSHHPSINYNVWCLQHSKASHIWWLFRLFMFIKTTFKLNVFEEVQVVLFDLFMQMLTEQDTDTDINVSWYYLLQFNVHSSSHSDVTPSTFPSCKSILFPWLACYFVSGSHSDKISLLFKKKTLFVIYYRHLKLGNWQPHVNLLHVTDQYFLLDCITCILFLIILQLGPYLRFWIGCMYSFYTFVKSYYWKQIFYVMSILCTFNM